MRDECSSRNERRSHDSVYVSIQDMCSERTKVSVYVGIITKTMARFFARKEIVTLQARQQIFVIKEKSQRRKRLGLENTGHECVWANEWLKNPRRIYKKEGLNIEQKASVFLSKKYLILLMRLTSRSREKRM